VHLAHNAIDHGIESVREREHLDKPVPATISLSAVQHEGGMILRVVDDGRGIDWKEVAARVRERGLEADSQAALERALFSDGLTTREAAGEVSDRGWDSQRSPRR
jgi:two-component system, chemotaxis family, sensor kinase CheA